MIVKAILSKTTKLETKITTMTHYAKINLMRDIDWNEANLRETKLRDSQLQNDITVCQRDS